MDKRTPNVQTHSVDVAVFGAGPAGIAAAIAAAREGQKTCLVKVQNKIGGVMSSCPGRMLGGGYPLQASCKKRSAIGFLQAGRFPRTAKLFLPHAACRSACAWGKLPASVVGNFNRHSSALAKYSGMILTNRLQADSSHNGLLKRAAVLTGVCIAFTVSTSI